MKTKTLLFALFISCLPITLFAQTFNNMTNPDPNHNNLLASWSYDDTHVFAGGLYETFLKYDGTSWTQVPISFSSFSISSIYGSSPTDVWLKGETDLAHYNGFNVTIVDIGNSNILRKMFGFSANNIYLCGNNGTLMHYDGSNWSSISSPYGSFDFWSMWGLSSSDLYFCGGDTYYPYTNRIIHYDGVTFTELKNFTGTDAYFSNIWSPDGNIFYISEISHALYCYNKTSNNLSVAYSGAIKSFCGIDANNFLFTTPDINFYDSLVVYQNGIYKSVYLNGCKIRSICAVNNNLSNVFLVGAGGVILHTDLTAGISSDFESLVKFNAYPNPSNGSDINIELNFEKSTKVEVVVLNSVGQQIETVFSGNYWGKESLKIDKNLSAGIYFVKVTTESGNSCSRKIVVTK